MSYYFKIILFAFMLFYMSVSIAQIIGASLEEEEPEDPTIYKVTSISAELDPEGFTIDNKKFGPKTYCDISIGDSVRFILEDPDDCVDIRIFNYRTKEYCDLWCN